MDAVRFRLRFPIGLLAALPRSAVESGAAIGSRATRSPHHRAG
jgi:hypothetical protein